MQSHDRSFSISNQPMKQQPRFLVSLFTIACSVGSTLQAIAQQTPNDILQKMADKLNSCQTIDYNFFRSVNYISEDYHNEIKANCFLDFKNSNTTLGFQYQIENEQEKLVYNGSESFLLNKKNATIKVNEHPQKDDFSALNFFYNSLVTLKMVLPVLIADKEMAKMLGDTTIDNKQLQMLTFVLHNKTINCLGTFTSTTEKIDFQYKLIYDATTFLPLQLVQSNNIAPADYVLTSFADIKINGIVPSETSWYNSTYSNAYRTTVETKLVLVKPKTVSPHWQLHYFESDDTIALHDLKGKVILLEFWMKNCGPCIAAIPKLNALVEKYKTKNFQLIGVNSQDTKERISQFYQRTKPSFKTVIDDKQIADNYGVQSFPTVVLLDQKGIVLYAGNFDQMQIEKQIKKALK